MRLLGVFWRKITNSRALAEAGPHEKMFFETIYRLVFFTGLSYADEGLWYKFYCAFIYGMSLSVIVLQVWHVISGNLTLEEMISVVNVIIIHLITCWKLVTMLVNKKMYRKVAKALESPYFDTSTIKRRQVVEYWTNTHRNFFRILMFMANGTLFFWNTFPLFDGEKYNLMIGIRLPIKYNTTFSYIITYIILGVIFNTASYLVIMSEVIMQAYLIPLICQYAILADCFENIFDDCAKNFEGADRDDLIHNAQFVTAYKKRLGSLVDQHLMILNQTMDLKGILSAPLLGQLCGSGMLICFVGYQATTTLAVNLGKFLMSMFYLGYNMYALYLICRWCEEITSQSQNIGDAAYSSGWENGMSQVSGVKATIMIVIGRANKPLIFVAGGMYHISLSSYTNLVKASYSALNILLRMSKD